MKTRIDSIHFTADQKLIDYISKKIQGVEKFFHKIESARISLKLENSGQVRDKLVELNLAVPGRRIIAKSSAKSFESAILQAISNAKRQMKRHNERLRAR